MGNVIGPKNDTLFMRIIQERYCLGCKYRQLQHEDSKEKEIPYKPIATKVIPNKSPSYP